MTQDKGKQYQPFVESLYTIFKGLSPTDQDEILFNLNKIIIGSRINPELRDMYNEEFEEVYGDLGELEAIEEITFLVGRSDLGSIERLKYITQWYDTRVAQNLYIGSGK